MDEAGQSESPSPEAGHNTANEALIRLLKEQAAALSELARFPDMNPGPVLRLSNDGIILAANRAAQSVLGADLVGRIWPEVCPGMTEARWRSVRDASVPTPVHSRVGDREFVFTHRCDPATSLIFIYGADVTELKEAQNTLRRQSEALTEMARFPDMNPGPVMRVSHEGKVLMANRAAHAVLGADLIDRRWPETCPGMSEMQWIMLRDVQALTPVEATIDGDPPPEAIPMIMWAPRPAQEPASWPLEPAAGNPESCAA